MEIFFNTPSWALSAIPDPKDPDPERYAMLAVLPYYLVVAFNRLIERGLPRGSPAIITSVAVEQELKSRKIVLEEVPSWTTQVSPLQQTLVIPNTLDQEPEEEFRSEQFLAKNIVIETTHVLFV